VKLFVLGNAPPGEEGVSISFRATATGTTPTGQQATLVVSQTGVLGRTPDLIRDFGFTAEVVDIHIHGNAAPAVAPSAAGPAALVAPAPLSPAQASHVQAIDAAFATYLDDAQLPGGSVHKRMPTGDAVFATSVDDPLV
jgi:hypothetical protein